MPKRPPRLSNPTNRSHGWQHTKTTTERGYGNDWRKCRNAYIAANPICVDPFGLHAGRIVPADHVDHIKPLAQGGERLDPDNLQALCKECHTKKTVREMHTEPTKFVMVCGPPGSGKTTYAKKMMRPRDVLIDQDEMLAAMFQTDNRSEHDHGLTLGLAARDAIIERLRQPNSIHKAWLVGVFSDPADRERQRAILDADVVIMPTSQDECRRRIRADKGRRGVIDRLDHVIVDWFRQNTEWVVSG